MKWTFSTNISLLQAQTGFQFSLFLYLCCCNNSKGLNKLYGACYYNCSWQLVWWWLLQLWSTSRNVYNDKHAVICIYKHFIYIQVCEIHTQHTLCGSIIKYSSVQWSAIARFDGAHHHMTCGTCMYSTCTCCIHLSYG